MTPQEMNSEKLATDSYSHETSNTNANDTQQWNVSLLIDLNHEMLRRLAPAVSVMAALMLVGVVGNVVICYIFTRKLRKSGQNFLLLCLGIFDLLSSCVGIPAEIFDMSNYYLYESARLCKAMRFLTTFPSLASILVLLVIAADRYRKICKPLHHQIHLIHTRIALAIIVIVAVAFSVPALYIYGHRTLSTGIPGLKGHDCSVDDAYRHRAYPVIYESVFCACFVLATITLISIYMRIWLETRRHFKYMKTHSNFGTGLTDETTGTSSANYDSADTYTDGTASVSVKSKSSTRRSLRQYIHGKRHKSKPKRNSEKSDSSHKSAYLKRDFKTNRHGSCDSNAISLDQIKALATGENNGDVGESKFFKVNGSDQDGGSPNELCDVSLQQAGENSASREFIPSTTRHFDREISSNAALFGSCEHNLDDASNVFPVDEEVSPISETNRSLIVRNSSSSTENSVVNMSHISKSKDKNMKEPQRQSDLLKSEKCPDDQPVTPPITDSIIQSNIPTYLAPPSPTNSENNASSEHRDVIDHSVSVFDWRRRPSMEKAMGILGDGDEPASMGFTIGKNDRLGHSQYLSDSDNEWLDDTIGSISSPGSKGLTKERTDDETEVSQPLLQGHEQSVQHYKSAEQAEDPSFGNINNNNNNNSHNKRDNVTSIVKSKRHDSSRQISPKVSASSSVNQNRISFLDQSEDGFDSAGSVEGAQSLRFSQASLSRAANQQPSVLKHSKSSQSLTGKRVKKALKATRTTIITFVITTAFILSYLPHLILITIRAVKTNFEHDLDYVSLNFYNIFLRSYFVNCVVNIFVYGTMNLEFRTQIAAIWRKMKKSCSKT